MATIAETPATVQELREKLLGYQEESGLSWQRVSDRSGIPSGTLTLWKAGNYTGSNENIASKVRRFLDGEAGKARMSVGRVEDPGFVLTPTARELVRLMQFAHLGDIVAIACAPGTGKTEVARNYKEEQAANVHVAAMSPSTSGLQPMQMRMLAAMGIHDLKGSPQQLSAAILKQVAGKNALIILDEAQELSEKALDEVRSWHDACGVGIVLQGDERVIARLGGRRRQELARLNSRIAMRHVQPRAKAEDAEMIARAWGVADDLQLKFLRRLSGKPGGLRSIVKLIKLAGLHSAHEARPLELADLESAWTQLNSDIVAHIAV
jgi:DNA transposition AAA+ family ATPase